MNDIKLYEKIPQSQFPIRILIYNDITYRFLPHWHEHTEFHYIFRGDLMLRSGESLVSLREGDLAIINGNELHQGMGSGKCDYTCIIVPPSFFDHNYSIFQKVVHDETVSSLIKRIQECYIRHEKVDLLEIKANMYYLISYLIRNYSDKKLNENTYSSLATNLNRINETIVYINNNYDRSITTQMLSDRVGLNEEYFCRVFKKLTGKTAIEYLNTLRIDKADTMLINTELSITEIAFRCGFENSNYFSRVFKKIKGITPKAKRDMLLNNESHN